jgi:hypothetical protein
MRLFRRWWGLLRYGVGLPHSRIEKLQANFKVPLAASTQWELVDGAAQTYTPVYEKMQDYGAEGTIIHNDDTTMTVLELTPEQRAAALGEEAAKKRTGRVHLGDCAGRGRTSDRAVFYRCAACGREPHGGPEAPLEKPAAADPDVRWPGSQSPQGVRDTVVSVFDSARRNFVDVATNVPEEVRFVLNTLQGDLQN